MQHTERLLGATAPPLVVLALAALTLTGCAGGYRPGTPAERGVTSAPGATIEDGVGRLTTDDGVEIYYHALGEGPNVLVVHGGPGFPPAEPWAVAETLADRYRFVFYDQRGSGRSDRPIDSFATRSWRKNAATLTDALGIEVQLADIERFRLALGDEQITIVGHSYGGFLAALYAAEFSDSVDRLVLISPATVVTMPNDENNLYDTIRAELPEARLAAYDEWQEMFFDYRHLWERDESELADINNAMVPFFVEAFGNEAAWGTIDVQNEGLTGGWIQPAIYLSLGRRYDLRPHFTHITADTVILAGAHDPALGSAPEAALTDYLEAIPGATFVLLPGEGHFPQNSPQEFAPALARALAGEL